MSLASTRRAWDDLAALDPMATILSCDGTWNESAFFESGEVEVAWILGRVARLGLSVRTGSALDFGCGLGRLTRALASRFDSVSGCDLAPGMVERARTLNAHVPNVSFATNDERLPYPDASFDFAYTGRVLQHVPSEAAILSYVRELVRVLAPGGVLVMQLPTRIPLLRRIQPRARLYDLLRSLGLGRSFLYDRLRLLPMRMTAADPRKVGAALRPCVLVHRDASGTFTGFPDALYFATRL